MIQNVLKKINRYKDPVYIQYLHFLASDKKTFFPGYFHVKENGKTYKITLPKYVDIDMALQKSTTTKEFVELKYIKLLCKTKIWKDIKLLYKENKYYHKDFIPSIKENLIGRTFFIDILPVIEETKEITVEKSKLSKRHEKIKNKVISNMLLAYPFNMFQFKTQKECESREVSKPYYISKKDMVNIISENNDIKKLYPKGYKNLKKEELCKVIFDNNKKNDI